MGTWLKRNTSRKYVLNQEERSMDVILEALLDSGQPEAVKAAFIARVCEQGAQTAQHPAATVRGVLEVASRWTLHGTTTLQVSSGFKLLSAWGRPPPSDTFPAFFTPELVSRLLQGHGHSQAHLIAANVPLFIREGLRVMSRAGPSTYSAHVHAVQVGVANFVRRCAWGDRLTVRNTGLLLREFPECIPPEDAQVLDVCVAILEHLAHGAPPQDGKMIVKFIRLTDEIAGFLNAVWVSRSLSVLEACLADVFRLISTQPGESVQVELGADGAQFKVPTEDPPICLAAVVQYIPLDIANRVVKEVVTDPSIPEERIEQAVGQIVEWLKWPSGCNVDMWLSCFLTELAAHRKFSLLARLTELNTEQIVENLMYPNLRAASFNIFSQMMLSFQHSPAPFHEALGKLMTILSDLRRQSSSSAEARSWLNSLAALVHCLMHQHSGFPELYDPVLDLIKDCPTPSGEDIRARLQRSSWMAQVSGSCAMETSAPAVSTAMTALSASAGQKKLEEGKTGLDNLGNTCYMNSVLQALYMCDQFRRGILSKLAGGQESVLQKLQQLFALLCQSNRASISPSNLLQASRPPWFLPGQQQDCSEFLKFLLDRLHEEERSGDSLSNGGPGSYMRSISSSSAASVSSISPGGTLSRSERKAAAAVTLTSIKMKLEDDNSDMTQLPASLVEKAFRGKVETTLRCLACGAESKRMENFSDIPLAFPNWSRLPEEFPHKNLAGGAPSSQVGGVVAALPQTSNGESSNTTSSGLGMDVSPTESSAQKQLSADDKPSEKAECSTIKDSDDGNSFTLNDLMAYYLKPERMTGDNKYHCDKCARLQDGERSIAIAESPGYLILSLLRFSYDTRVQARTKIFQDVRYPRTMAVPVSCRTPSSPSPSCSPTPGASFSRQGSQQHSRNSSSSSFTLANNNNNDNSKNLHELVYQEKLQQLARRLCPQVENSIPPTTTKGKLTLPSQGSAQEQECELYGLSAVIIHSGTSSECGHYYCYARHSQAGQIDPGLLDKLDGEDIDTIDLLPDQWYNFNDSRVSHASFEGFSNVTKRFSKDTAYVLIYRKLELNPRVCMGSLDPVLRPELRSFVTKDNETYLKEQELEARIKDEQRKRAFSVTSAKFSQWTKRDDNDDEDDENGGGGSYKGPGCGPGMNGGLDTSGSRFVF